jgi:hypothetical protein
MFTKAIYNMVLMILRGEFSILEIVFWPLSAKSVPRLVPPIHSPDILVKIGTSFGYNQRRWCQLR